MIDRRPTISGITGHFQWLGNRTEEHQSSIDAETSQHRAHRFTVRHRGENDFGTAQLQQLGSGILRAVINIVNRAPASVRAVPCPSLARWQRS